MNVPRDLRAAPDGQSAGVRDPDELSDDQLEFVLGGLARPWTEGLAAPSTRRAAEGPSDAASALVA